VILRFLQLNSSDEEKSYWQGVWKILLYDDYCRNLLGPILKVGQLRKQGITLHLYLPPFPLAPTSCAAHCPLRVVVVVVVVVVGGDNGGGGGGGLDRCTESDRRYKTCQPSIL